MRSLRVDPSTPLYVLCPGHGSPTPCSRPESLLTLMPAALQRLVVERLPRESRVGPVSANKSLATTDQVLARVGQFGPQSATAGQVRLSETDVRPGLVGVGQTWANLPKFGRLSGICGRIWAGSRLAQQVFDNRWATFGQQRSSPGSPRGNFRQRVLRATSGPLSGVTEFYVKPGLCTAAGIATLDGWGETRPAQTASHKPTQSEHVPVPSGARQTWGEGRRADAAAAPAGPWCWEAVCSLWPSARFLSATVCPATPPCAGRAPAMWARTQTTRAAHVHST